MRKICFLLVLSAVLAVFMFSSCKLGHPSNAEKVNFKVGNVEFAMVYVEGGTFTMGATPEQDGDADADEYPPHRITLDGYYIGETEVTQALWEAVMTNNPSGFIGYNLPVESVSYDDCQEFIRRLNKLTGRTFRLPTEAEWEYAARGGSKSRGYKFSGSDYIDNVAWYVDNTEFETHPVKAVSPNELGLYDMSGNVFEWCSDWYGDYSGSPQTNPAGPDSGTNRVFRGGGWDGSARYCRVSIRYGDDPANCFISLGLRLALSE